MGKQLLMLCGSQGSGKTMFARRLKALDSRWFIVSSDAYRMSDTGKVNIFHKPFKTFNKVDSLVCDALERHDYVIYDACSLTRYRRLSLLHRLKDSYLDVSITVVVFRVPYSVCVQRDRSEERDHHVGKWIIGVSKVLTKLNRPNISEGYDMITTPKAILKSVRGCNFLP